MRIGTSASKCQTFAGPLLHYPRGGPSSYLSNGVRPAIVQGSVLNWNWPELWKKKINWNSVGVWVEERPGSGPGLALAYIRRGLCNFSVTLEIYKFSLVFLCHFPPVVFIFFLFFFSFSLVLAVVSYPPFPERVHIKPAGRRFITKRKIPGKSGRSQRAKGGGALPEWSREVCNVNKWIGRNQR